MTTPNDIQKNLSPLYNAQNSASTRWLAKASHMLVEDAWPISRTISFDGSGFPFDTQDAANRIFLDAVKKNGKVTSIGLKNQTLGLKAQLAFLNIISTNSNLNRLNLCNVSTSDPSDLVLNSSFSNSNIQELTLQKCRINEEMALVLGQRIKSGLKKLKLINLDLDIESLELIEGIVHGSLFHLELRDVRIEHNLLMRLIEGLESNTCLEELTLEHCGIDSTDVEGLSKLVANNNVLRSLSLSSNNLDGESIGVLSEIGLRENKSLRKLILSCNPIGDVGAKHLTKLLISNPTIQSLSLVDCEIWSKGCTSIARGLAKMKGLKILIVDSEWENHADTLLTSMKSNYSLVQLLSDRTAMLMSSDPQWKQLGFYLRLNKAKRRILVEPGVPTSLWSQILAENNRDSTILYHFLSHKPELVPAK